MQSQERQANIINNEFNWKGTPEGKDTYPAQPN